MTKQILNKIPLTPFTKGGIPAISLLIFLACSKILADTHYVSQTGSNSPPYTNWATAAHIFQNAVNAAESNDIVLVADGVYDSGGALTPSYGLSNRVMINKPIEVRSVNGPEVTSIVGKGPVGSSSVRCVYLTNGAFLTGFTLKNGYADSLSGGVCLDHGCVVSNCVITGCERRGALLYWDGLLTDCVVSNNSYGGVFISRNGRVDGCTISDNFSTNRYGKGGGVYISMDGVVERCLISGNRLTGERSEGGGVYFGQEPTFTGWAVVRFSTIVGNSAGLEGGGVRITGNEYDWALVDNCTICSNSVGEYGGGVSFWYGGRVNDCRIFENTAGIGGGGFYFFADLFNPIQHGEARNCTIVNNNAQYGGGIGNNGARGDVYNSIIYFNNAPNYTNYYQFYIVFQSCCSEPQPPGTGNIGGYPLFQDIYSADYHLLKMSPCIDTGNNALTNGLGMFDLDGLPRILGATVNMGCYEQNRDPDIPPPVLNSPQGFTERKMNLFSFPTTNIYINGTKTAGKFVVAQNQFGGCITNGVAQTLSGSEWTNCVNVPIVSSNTFFYRQASANQAAVSTGFVARTVVIVPEPFYLRFEIFYLLFIILRWREFNP